MKKVLALLLVIVLALGMSTVGFARIVGIQNNANNNFSGTDYNPTTHIANLGGIHAGTEYFITFNPDVTNIFNDNADSPQIVGTAGVTRNDISKGKVTLRTQLASGSSQVIDSVSWDYDRNNSNFARIKVAFVNPFVNNNPDGVEFEFDVYMVVNGQRFQEDSRVTLTGTLANPQIFVDASNDYANFEDGNIITADEYVKSIELALNDSEDISAYAKMFKDRDVYSFLSTDPTAAQEELMDKYGIDQVFNISEKGLASIVDRIVFNNADRDFYVYNGDFEYLGQVKDANFDFYNTYYLAEKKLDIDEEIEEEPEEEDIPEAPPVTGDADYEENDNFNPSTGA